VRTVVLVIAGATQPEIYLKLSADSYLYCDNQQPKGVEKKTTGRGANSSRGGNGLRGSTQEQAGFEFDMAGKWQEPTRCPRGRWAPPLGVLAAVAVAASWSPHTAQRAVSAAAATAALDIMCIWRNTQ
jgi:hypothetical protein